MKKIVYIVMIASVFILGAGAEQWFDLTSTVITTIQDIDLQLKGDLLFETDGSYNIGASAASRPGDIHLSDDLTVGDDAKITGDLSAKTINYGGVSTSAAGTDSFVVTIAPAPSALAAGLPVIFKPDTANTGGCFINVNSLGWKAIKTASNADPANDDLVVTTMALLIYNGTSFILINPATTTD